MGNNPRWKWQRMVWSWTNMWHLCTAQHVVKMHFIVLKKTCLYYGIPQPACRLANIVMLICFACFFLPVCVLVVLVFCVIKLGLVVPCLVILIWRSKLPSELIACYKEQDKWQNCCTGGKHILFLLSGKVSHGFTISVTPQISNSISQPLGTLTIQ